MQWGGTAESGLRTYNIELCVMCLTVKIGSKFSGNVTKEKKKQKGGKVRALWDATSYRIRLRNVFKLTKYGVNQVRAMLVMPIAAKQFSNSVKYFSSSQAGQE